MKTVVVTGSEGFLGKYVCQAFLDAGWDTIGIDNRFKYGHNEDRCVRGVSYEYKDVRYTGFEWLVRNRKPNVVVDLASIVGGAQFLYGNHLNGRHSVYWDLSNNIDMHKRVIEACILAGSCVFEGKPNSHPRLITISSSAIYERVNVYSTPEYKIDDIPTPTHWYGLYKYMCERLTTMSGLDYTILRLFNCAGLGDDDLRSSHVIPQLIRNFKAGDFTVYGDGSETRTFTHCTDVANAIVKVADDDSFISKVVNIANSQNITSIGDLAVKILQKVLRNKSPKVANQLTYIADRRLSPIIRSEANNTMSVSLGIEYKVGLDEIIKESVPYYN